MNNFEFTYNVAYDTFTHDESGYMLSGDYLRGTPNGEVQNRIYDATGIEVDYFLIDTLRGMSKP